MLMILLNSRNYIPLKWDFCLYEHYSFSRNSLWDVIMFSMLTKLHVSLFAAPLVLLERGLKSHKTTIWLQLSIIPVFIFWIISTIDYTELHYRDAIVCQMLYKCLSVLTFSYPVRTANSSMCIFFMQVCFFI